MNLQPEPEDAGADMPDVAATAAAAATTIDKPAPETIAEAPPPRLPLKAGQTVEFTPPAAAAAALVPVFRLKVPNITGRGAVTRHLIALFGEYPDDAFLRRTLRRAVKSLFEDDDAERRLASIAALEEATGAPSLELLDAYREIEFEVERQDSSYRALVATRRIYTDSMSVVCLQHFLVGWDNGPCDFLKKGSLVAESCLAALPRIQFVEIATYAMSLMNATEQLAKN